MLSLFEQQTGQLPLYSYLPLENNFLMEDLEGITN
jgi:hypothetical protein